ncbi:MAG: T9SS type A sorting domain-containing protein [Ignavibacteriae bacterium]|nr:T9SS type A sorting domain-containing protein [Ignavibacteriota bacterium]
MLSFVILSFNSYSASQCDSLKACIGNALTLSVTSGNAAEYVDVNSSVSLFSYTNELTVEFWFKPERQSGKTQFVAGIWGPAEDANDVWAIYISPDDNLIFELNHPNFSFKSSDNTIVGTPISAFYSNWVHGAFVFNGSNNTATIYINGSTAATASNTNFPLSVLKKPERADLSLQIGSTNALWNEPNNNRTFLGQIDEFRIWHRVRTAAEIYCGKDMSLEGNESGLILYHRYNQNPTIFNLCDATDFGNNGIARSNAACRQSNRSFKRTVLIEPDISVLRDTLKCENTKEWKFKVRDTSSCSKTLFVRVIGDGNQFFKVTPNRFNNTNQNQEYEFTVSFDGELIGNIAPTLQIYSLNRCRDLINIPVRLTRGSELSYSKDSLGFDMLKAMCRETPFIDSVITICNTTTNKTLRINSLISSIPEIFQVISPSVPFDIQPGDCRDVTIRFRSKDTTELYKGKLTILSNDECNSIVEIDLVGKVQEVIGIYQTNGIDRLPPLDFGTVCVNFASDAIQYMWANLLIGEKITVDTIIFPDGFTGVPFRYPVTLDPETGYLPDFFRFYPTRKGIYNDSIIFVVRSGGCTIHKAIYVRGVGYEAELEFILPEIDFGSIPVGQSRTVDVEVRNKSSDPIRVSFYVKEGSGFFLTGSRTINIPPNGVGKVPLTFNPSQAKEYFDEVCFFETRCYNSGCIPVKGNAYIERFSYEPDVLRINDVIGCQTGRGTIKFKNESSGILNMNEFFFADTSGRFKLINPSTLPTAMTLNPDQTFDFEVEYSPNDVTRDRVDRAFIYFKTSDGIEWNLKIIGTSQSPKIFVTQESAFGQLEVGDTRRRVIMIENISLFDIKIDSIISGQDFNIIYPQNFTGAIINPRDTIRVTIEFAPTQDKFYNEKIRVYSSSPCPVQFSGDMSGRGLIVPLDIPVSVLSFGYIKPCGCSERRIQLINESAKFDMIIDSIYIDGANIVNAYPELYTWNSDIMTKSAVNLPYSIPPSTRDTLRINYCPGGVFDRDSINHEARIWIKAHGNGWDRLYNVYLAGKMELLFESDNHYLDFPPTRVDTFASPRFTKIKIPPIEFNQNQETVVIDSITFMPNERVFSASINGFTDFPVELQREDSLVIQIDFKPRAVREYRAKMVIHYSKPCNSADTTILVYGSGYAPAFGLSFNFDNLRIEPDTLRFISCDTLYVPVYSSRKFPADVVDIKLRLGYDTTKLNFAGYESPYLRDTCKPHIPSISHQLSQYGGSEFLLKNFCSVDSIRPIMYAKYTSKFGLRDTFNISIDSISFDTEEVILFNIVAANDYGTVIILQPEIKITSGADFDSVQVLDCVTRLISIVNIGDVSLEVNDLIDLPDDVKIVNMTPVAGTYIEVGDSAVIEIEFCPRRSGERYSLAKALSFEPCDVTDTVSVEGIGYAPEFPVRMDISYNFDTPDTLNYFLGDTVIVSIFNENDFSAIRNNIEYHIMGLSFDVYFVYNPRTLKLLSTSNRIGGEMITGYQHGLIRLSFIGINALKRGEIADLKFLSVVPDSIFSTFDIFPADFSTDSIMFLDLIPVPLFGYCNSGGRCNLTYLKFTDNNHNLDQNFPNPWNDYTDIRFSIMERVPVYLEIYNTTGERVMTLLDGTQVMSPGEYSVRLPSDGLNSGVYFYTIRAGIFAETKKMILVK